MMLAKMKVVEDAKNDVFKMYFGDRINRIVHMIKISCYLTNLVFFPLSHHEISLLASNVLVVR